MNKKMIFFFIALGFLLVLVNYSYCQSEKPLLTIGNQSFTIKDFEEYLGMTGFKAQNMNSDIKKRLLDQFTREKIFVAAVKDAGIEITDEQKKHLDRIKQMYLIQNYIEKILSESPITETEIRQVYDKQPQQYIIPEKRKIRHIIVQSEEKAKEILEKLQEGISFEELAKQNNTDATKQRGGDLGWVGKGVFVKEFEDVAFSLGKGEISNIVKTQFGYHIIRVDDIEGSKQRSFPEVQQEIKRKLEQGRILNIEEVLKKKYNVQIDYSLVR